MNYKLEKELKSDIINRDMRINKYGNCYLGTEISIGECIPDILIVGFDKEISKFDSSRKMSSKHVYLFWIIKSYEYISIEDITKISFQRKSKVIQLLDDLSTLGIIKKEEGSGRYIPEREITNIKSEVVAIEAKLSNWRQALIQAQRYKKFADKVLVVMDADKAPRRNEDLRKFNDAKVGLCALSPKSCEWLVIPSVQMVNSFEKEYIISSVLFSNTHKFWDRRKFTNASLQA